MMRFLSIALAMIGLVGCATAPPPTMTPLERVSIQWVDAYWAAVNEGQRLHIKSVVPCDASLTIALTASQDGQLGISAKPEEVPVGITAMLSGTKQAANTATMDFKSDVCAKALAKQAAAGSK